MRSNEQSSHILMSANVPQVSVVIVNWNGADHLRLCLPSLAAQSLPPQEVIVVDNQSTDDSAAVTESFGARWLPLESNIGLAPAMNRGAQVAAGEFLLFVNNDMRFDPGFIATLVAALQSDKNLFAAGGMQFNWDGTERGHLATRITKSSDPRTGLVELVPGLYFYPQEQSQITKVFMASAACILIRRKLFDEIAGFDDRLPFGYEDVEICWRAWAHGWPIAYAPSAICWHRIGGSARSEAARLLGFRGVLTGRLLLATKMLPAGYTLRAWLITIAGLVKDLLRLKWRFAAARIKILTDMLSHVPALRRERKVIFENANRSPEAQLRLLIQLTDNDR
jgi:GT2 family glycosyltransferase